MQSYYYKYFLSLLLVILLFYSILGIIALFFDGLSLFIVKNTLGRDIKNQIRKKHFGLIYVFTLVSYVLSIFTMFIMFAVENGEFNILTFLLVIYRVATEPVTNSQMTLIYLISIFIAIISNIIFNYFIVFRNIYFTRIGRFFSSIIVSGLTAPYFFLVSFEGLIDFFMYGSI